MPPLARGEDAAGGGRGGLEAATMPGAKVTVRSSAERDESGDAAGGGIAKRVEALMAAVFIAAVTLAVLRGGRERLPKKDVGAVRSAAAWLAGLPCA